MSAWLVCAFLLGVLAWLARDRVRERERLARCAHEVRGPLTALSLALHGAGRRGELAPTRLAGLELELRRAALALDDLRGGPAATSAPVDVRDLVELQVATWSEVAHAHGARLRLEATPRPGAAVVHGEAVRLAQAVGNLLANAIEHGGGEVVVRVLEAEGAVRVEVRDGGPGLPAHRHDVPLLAGRSRRARGHGLGVAADAVRRHGGRLLALPSPRGARLALELPARREA